jgi:hypothetical protein
MNRHLDEISAARRVLLHLGVVNLLLKIELRDRTALDFDLDEAGARPRRPSGVADRNFEDRRRRRVPGLGQCYKTFFPVVCTINVLQS